MRKEDFLICQCLDIGELAFYMSPYAKYGVDGKVKFLRPWLQSYIKNIKVKKNAKYLKSVFLKFNSDSKLTNHWVNHIVAFKLMRDTIKRHKDDSDLKRLQLIIKGTSIPSECSPSGNSNPEEIQRVLILLSKEQLGLIDSDGNIPSNTTIQIVLEHEANNNEVEETLGTIQDYGFSIEEIIRSAKTTKCLISTSFNNNYVKLIDGRAN